MSIWHRTCYEIDELFNFECQKNNISRNEISAITSMRIIKIIKLRGGMLLVSEGLDLISDGLYYAVSNKLKIYKHN